MGLGFCAAQVCIGGVQEVLRILPMLVNHSGLATCVDAQNLIESAIGKVPATGLLPSNSRATIIMI